MNPLTDELSPDAKAWLVVMFAELERRFKPKRVRRRKGWWER